MRNVAFARAIEPRTLWIRARESSIPLWRWRRRYHSGPPVLRNGPKDTDLTSVVPCYYSPGLPRIASEKNLRIEFYGTTLPRVERQTGQTRGQEDAASGVGHAQILRLRPGVSLCPLSHSLSPVRRPHHLSTMI